MPFQRVISAWQNGGLFFERYRYTKGKHQPLDAHSHPEFQIGLAINTYGKYLLKGESRLAPAGSLSIIHSGEPHRPDGRRDFEKPCGYLMLYAAPADFHQAAAEIGWKKTSELPFFKDFVFRESDLIRKYLRLHRISSRAENRLAFDVARLDFLTFLIKNFSQAKSAQTSLKPHQQAIRIVREYLDANFSRQISLDELAGVANLSKYHLCRKFSETVGVAPHVYQNQLRLNAAKKMLIEHRDLTQIALELGFYDQSHFGRYFKKFSGVSPRVYAGEAIFS